MASWAILKVESKLTEIFPERRIPIGSIIPIVPREKKAPWCFLALGDQFSVRQVDLMAALIHAEWQHECRSAEAARKYILEGVPLDCAEFERVFTDDQALAGYARGVNQALQR